MVRNAKLGIEERKTDLGAERSGSGTEETFTIAEIDGSGEFLEVFDDLFRRSGEGFSDDGGVNSFGEELLRSVEERAGEDDDGGGTVSRFDILGGRKVDELERKLVRMGRN